MEIILKNGEKLNLDWSPVVIEYLEDYDGGLKQLKNDLESKENPFRIFNFIIYSFIAAVYPIDIGYREALSLVDPNDLEKIVDFTVEKINGFESTNSDVTPAKLKVKKHIR